MKNLPIILVALSIAFYFNSCKEEAELTPNPDYEIKPTQIIPGNFVSEMSAQLDDTLINFNFAKGNTYGKFLSIVGFQGFDSLYISTSSLQPGVYTSSSSGLNGIYYSINGKTYSSSFFNPANAQIRISKYDASTGLASGIFSGTIKDITSQDTIEIKRGKFTNIKVIKKQQIRVGSMSADIDSSRFNSYFCVYKPNIQNSGMNAISGSNTGVTQSITIQFNDTIRVKTYTIGSNNEVTATYFANLTAGTNPIRDIYSANSGQIIVNSVDTLRGIVKGSFNFIGSNGNNKQVSVANGSFEAARP